MPKAGSSRAIKRTTAGSAKPAKAAPSTKQEGKLNAKSSKAKGKRKSTTQKFDYDLPYEELDLRKNPEMYSIGIGEQGVFAVQPYKSELLPLWRFATPQIATTSSSDLWKKFKEYRDQGDFVGCDMARKFIQMGFTRSRRYANHSGGRKYDRVDGQRAEKERGPQDEEKAECAEIFKEVLDQVKADTEYERLREEHLKLKT